MLFAKWRWKKVFILLLGSKALFLLTIDDTLAFFNVLRPQAEDFYGMSAMTLNYTAGRKIFKIYFTKIKVGPKPLELEYICLPSQISRR